MSKLSLIALLNFIFVQVSMANDLNSYILNGKEIIQFKSKEGFRGLNIRSKAMVEGVSFDCKIPVKYRLQSQDENSQWTTWIDQSFQEEVSLKGISNKTERFEIESVSLNQAKLHKYLNEQINGIKGKVVLRSYTFNNAGVSCNTFKREIEDYCEHYFHPEQILSPTNKVVLNDLFNSLGEGAPTGIQQCLTTVKKIKNNRDLILKLSVSHISDISFFKHLKYLKGLIWKRTSHSDFSFLKRLAYLKVLDLEGSHKVDVNSLRGLKRLEKLSLKNTRLTQTNFLREMLRLQEVDLSENNIQIAELARNNSKLKILNISHNPQLSQVRGGDINALTTLIAKKTILSSLAFHLRPSLLSVINLAQNPEALNALSSVVLNKQVSKLDLSYNGLKRIYFLSSFDEILNLNLAYNPIEDFSPLKELVSINGVLNLAGTPAVTTNHSFDEGICPITLIPNPEEPDHSNDNSNYETHIPGDALTPYCQDWQQRDEPNNN